MFKRKFMYLLTTALISTDMGGFHEIKSRWEVS